MISALPYWISFGYPVSRADDILCLLGRPEYCILPESFPSFPPRGSLSSEVKWNSTSNLPSRHPSLVQEGKKKRSNWGTKNLGNRLLNLETRISWGLRLRLRRSVRKQCMSGNNTNIYRRSWSIEMNRWF